ncbi:MAG: EAL domain-containing protein [Vulcanimicrobiota bacterium]
MDVKLEREEQRANEAEARLAELEGGSDSAAAPPADLQAELEAARAEASELRQTIDELQQQLAEVPELRATIVALQSQPTAEPDGPTLEELDTARAEASGLRQTIDDLQQQLAEVPELRQTIDDLRTQLEQPAELPEEIQIRLHEAEERARQAEETLETLRGSAGTVEEQLREVQQRVREAQERAVEWEEKFHRSQERVKQVEAEALSGDSSHLQLQVDQMRERLSLANERSELLNQRAQQFEERARTAEEKLRHQEDDLKTASANVARLQAECEEYQTRFRSYQAQTEERLSTADNVEVKVKEVWAKVREAETRANQAEVQLQKAVARLKEYEQRANESDRETQRLAFQDTLTGLPNLNLMRQYLDFTVKQVTRYGRASALLVVDLDRFKLINDAMGFKAGDELLMRVSERLQAAIRESDAIGRRGEDEFLILLSELYTGEENVGEAKKREIIEQNIAIVVRRVTEGLARPFTIQGQKFYIRASIGVSVCPNDAESAQQMLEHADSAMYHAKENGRGRCVFYNSDLHRLQERRLTLDSQLRVAMEKNEFELHYQPIVEVAKGRAAMVGVEALLRWNHRIEGTLYPEYFLPAAEESGLIVHLGKWVCQQACWQLSKWIQQGLRIFVSVNVSFRQMLQADLAETFLQSVQEFQLPPELLFVEIAEGVNAERADLVEEVVTSLGKAGIRIAIDDFGSGYSSLSRFDLNHTKILKIDPSIVSGCPREKQSVNICTAAISLAQSLGLRPLAEGVENAAQAKFLAKAGCQFMQGYFFQAPAPPEAITQLAIDKKVWKL